MRTTGLLWLLFAGVAVGFSVANVAQGRYGLAAVATGAALLFYAGSVVIRRWAR